jgi:hypothetical protein
MRIKIAQYGLGPIGIQTLKLAAKRSWFEVLGAVDIDPDKADNDLGTFLQEENLAGMPIHRSLDELCATKAPRLIFHTTVSSFSNAFSQLEPIVRRGISVVSSCEELVFPQLRQPALASRLDSLCRETGARVVGTGVNPGFVMDLLPICLTGVSREIRAVHVQRVVNASTRRGPLQRKIGSGLPAEHFQRLLTAGQAGHAGLKESLALIAHCLAWPLEHLQETGAPVVAEQDISTEHLQVKAGQTCGLHQRAEGRVNGRTCLTLDLKMYLDAKNPHDAIQIDGDPPLNLVIKGGIAGDEATVAALVNTAPRLLDSPPGLRLVTDLPAPCYSRLQA